MHMTEPDLLCGGGNGRILRLLHRRWVLDRASCATRFVSKLVLNGGLAANDAGNAEIGRVDFVPDPASNFQDRPSYETCRASRARHSCRGRGLQPWRGASARYRRLGRSAGRTGRRRRYPAKCAWVVMATRGLRFKGPDGKMRSLFVDKEKFEHSVHGGRQCVDCHTNITQVPHPPTQVRVSCVNCHESLWETAQKEGKTQEFATLGFVVQQIDKFMNSIHARPSRAGSVANQCDLL